MMRKKRKYFSLLEKYLEKYLENNSVGACFASTGKKHIFWFPFSFSHRSQTILYIFRTQTKTLLICILHIGRIKVDGRVRCYFIHILYFSEV